MLRCPFIGRALMGMAVSIQIAFSLESAAVEIKKDVTYATVDQTDLQLDLYMPTGINQPVPAIVVIHGGAWMTGNRQDMAFVAEQLAKHGFVSASISYRLAPKHRFPSQIEDAKAAVRYLRANAKELHIDPSQIGATGISAGGHLSMMLGAMDSGDGMEGDGGNLDHPSKVQCVVNFIGPVNLPRETYTPLQMQILKAWLGADPMDKQDELKLASPYTYFNKGDAPLLCFFGTKDPLVTHDQALVVADALTQAEIPGRIEMLLGAGHGWRGAEMDRTLEATIDFFKQHLKSHD
jgi:acetyl esterase/lipase